MPPLRHGHPHEGGVRPQVAPPQPAGLLDEPVGPLHAHLLPRERRAPGDAGEHVERPADAVQDGHAERVAVLAEEDLLLRRGHAEEQHVGLGGADLGGDHGGLGVVEVPVAAACEDQAGPALGDDAGQRLHHLGGGAEQEHPVAVLVGQVEQALEDVDPGGALGQGLAHDAAGPDDGLAVGEQEVALEQRVAQQRVVAQVDHLGRVEHAEHQPAAGRDRLLAALDDLGHGEGGDVETEQAPGRHVGEGGLGQGQLRTHRGSSSAARRRASSPARRDGTRGRPGWPAGACSTRGRAAPDGQRW